MRNGTYMKTPALILFGFVEGILFTCTVGATVMGVFKDAKAPEWLSFAGSMASSMFTAGAILVAIMAVREQRRQTLAPLYRSEIEGLKKKTAELLKMYTCLRLVIDPLRHPSEIEPNRSFIMRDWGIPVDEGSVDFDQWAERTFANVPGHLQREIASIAARINFIPQAYQGMTDEQRSEFIMKILELSDNTLKKAVEEFSNVYDRQMVLEKYMNDIDAARKHVA